MDNISKELLLRAWQHKNFLFYFILLPLSWLFSGIVWLRKRAYQVSLLKSYALPVPVIVVGNIHVGGTGKTPAVIWLANALKAKGYVPAVISRGYGGHNEVPSAVTPESLASEVGDEPLLIAKRIRCPLWIGRDRVAAGQALLQEHPQCNVIISDDGLQHYRLKRDVEIAIFNEDGLNPAQAYMLPAGPLREPISRLNTVDAIICNGTSQSNAGKYFAMQLEGDQFYNLKNPKQKAKVADFKHKSVMAMAGIGKPERFFTHLQRLGLTFAKVSFEDHYAYQPADLSKLDCDVLLMTEKDAVKCAPFAQAHHWVLPVEAQMDKALLQTILQKIAEESR